MEETLNNNNNNNTNVSAGSPQQQPLPQVMNMNMNMNVGDTAGGSVTTPTTVINPAVQATTTTVQGQGGSFDLFGTKKKRGRPRKYDSDGNLRITSGNAKPITPQGFTLSTSTTTEFSSKRGRGRTSTGFGNYQQILASFGE